MGYGFKHGAGGTSPLDFRVLGGTEQPAAPRVNDIWVDTGTAVSGWSISPAAPDAPYEGMVWLSVDASSEVSFNALKKNALMVSPAQAYQYIDGAFSSVDAWLYDGVAWVQFSMSWDGYYFKDGDQYEDITGGWSSDGWNNLGTVNIGDTLSVLSAHSSKTARVGTVDKVDLTDVDTIWYDSPNGKNGNVYSGYLYVTTEKADSANVVVAQATISSAGTGSIDVSSLSGSYYLCLRTMGGSASGSGYGDIRAIWTE